jgi:Uncharacterised nucleotidyltransferase
VFPGKQLDLPNGPTETPSAAMRFVRLCGRATLVPTMADAVSAAGVRLSASDWRQVVHVAANEGMLPLVFVHAARAGLLQAMPAVTAQAIAVGHGQTLVNNRSLLGEQHALVAALDARGLPAIPLKGLSLAVRYYDQIGMRPTSDIDLLVRRADMRRVDRTLRELGYRSLGGRATLWNFAALLHGDLCYASPKGAKLELHWELTHRATYRAGLSVDRAWAATRTTEVAGASMRCLSVSDELRFLCVHCTAGHQVVPAGMRLIWLVDIAKLLSSLPPRWSWQAFLEETIALRLAMPVYLALGYCEAYLGIELPPGALEALRDASNAQQERDAWRFAAGSIFTVQGFRAHLSAARSITQVIAFLRGIIVPSPTWIRTNFAARRNERDLPLWRAYAHFFTRLLKRLPELLLSKRAR